MTTFVDGVSQWGGVPVGVNPLYNKIMQGTSGNGKAWFVNPNQGNSSGKGPQQTFSTMAEAFDNCKSGDIIYAIGNIREQLITPVQVFDVTVVGCGNRPRNADAVPLGGALSAVTWRAPASGGTAAQATVRVLQQGWRFINILFGAIDTNAAMIELVRNADADDAERDASHASIIGCRFAGAGVGIRGGVAGVYTEIPFNVEIMDNDFYACTYGIRSAIQCNAWQIKNNRFNACTNAITAQLGASLLTGNMVTGFTASGSSGGIDLRSGAGANMISGNMLGGAYSNAGGYNGSSSDQWWGNFADVTGGVTQADPA